jgi:hypothetical protein
VAGWTEIHRALKVPYVICVFAGVALGRSQSAIHHLIPDPALGFQTGSPEFNLASLLRPNNGYLQFAPWILAELLDFVPISQLTYWATSLNAGLLGICGAAVFFSARASVGRLSAAMVAVVAIAPFPAHEGLVGNIWAIRWPLLATSFIVLTSLDFCRRHTTLCALLFTLTGLSNAYVIVVAVMAVALLVATRTRDPRLLLHLAVLATCSAIQVTVFLRSGTSAQLYGEATPYLPWNNAGSFWWSIFLGPPTLALLALVFALLTKSGIRDRASVAIVSISALALCVVVYLQLGIKSSPAVATLPASFFVLLYARPTSTDNYISKFSLYLSAIAVATVAMLTVRFYDPGYYLTSSRGWHREVQSGLVRCQMSPTASIELVFFQYSDTTSEETLSCEELEKWDRWWWSR